MCLMNEPLHKPRFKTGDRVTWIQQHSAISCDRRIGRIEGLLANLSSFFVGMHVYEVALDDAEWDDPRTIKIPESSLEHYGILDELAEALDAE